MSPAAVYPTPWAKLHRMRIGRILALMEDHFLVTCPYCGEEVEIFLEPDVSGELVQDCEVCCNPCLVRVWGDAGGRQITVGRADGSE